MNKILNKVIVFTLVILCGLITIGNTNAYAYAGDLQTKVVSQSNRSIEYSVVYTSVKHWNGKRYGYKAVIPLKITVSKGSDGKYHFSNYTYSDIKLIPKLKNQTLTLKSSRTKKVNRTFFELTGTVNNNVPGDYHNDSFLRINFHVNPTTGQITAEDK